MKYINYDIILNINNIILYFIKYYIILNIIGIPWNSVSYNL